MPRNSGAPEPSSELDPRAGRVKGAVVGKTELPLASSRADTGSTEQGTSWQRVLGSQEHQWQPGPEPGVSDMAPSSPTGSLLRGPLVTKLQCAMTLSPAQNHRNHSAGPYHLLSTQSPVPSWVDAGGFYREKQAWNAPATDHGVGIRDTHASSTNSATSTYLLPSFYIDISGPVSPSWEKSQLRTLCSFLCTGWLADPHFLCKNTCSPLRPCPPWME